MRRWQREVALAVMLTVAAVAFIAAAFLRGDGVAGQRAVRDRAQAAAELDARSLRGRYCAVQPPSIE